MKTNKNMEELFEDLNFDIEEPHSGHRERFRRKLEKQSGSSRKSKVRKLWNPFMGIAAGFLFAIFLAGQFFGDDLQTKQADLASISPEMKQTQEFYTSVISKELSSLAEEKTPETEAIVNDALKQMEKLEKEYEGLKKDLHESGNDNRVIYAMIQNFQQRIDLLNSVLEKIEHIKQLKTNTHENNII
ncbi:hypothetical protein C7S20_16385 [Christiangramia fulva]|uniref:DUF4179 domain-containing protein n=1 Tax=Christiangramia fulva TaxID=2126553 RepID=A0A2R3Z8W1_9FLAO|nr:hypothetical protein [Christiangramia fulva]AVR46716.1 hypothetical protein C7S20_16385 [Christiangramia fulva]